MLPISVLRFTGAHAVLQCRSNSGHVVKEDPYAQEEVEIQLM